MPACSRYPNTAPAPARTQPSASRWPTICHRPAPIALRIAISRRRERLRASSRPATLEHAISAGIAAHSPAPERVPHYRDVTALIFLRVDASGERARAAKRVEEIAARSDDPRRLAMVAGSPRPDGDRVVSGQFLEDTGRAQIPV